MWPMYNGQAVVWAIHFPTPIGLCLYIKEQLWVSQDHVLDLLRCLLSSEGHCSHYCALCLYTPFYISLLCGLSCYLSYCLLCVCVWRKEAGKRIYPHMCQNPFCGCPWLSLALWWGGSARPAAFPSVPSAAFHCKTQHTISGCSYLNHI